MTAPGSHCVQCGAASLALRQDPGVQALWTKEPAVNYQMSFICGPLILLSQKSWKDTPWPLVFQKSGQGEVLLHKQKRVGGL